MTHGRFRFPLQRLLAIRKKAEDEASVELAIARGAEADALLARTALDTQRAEARDALMPTPGSNRAVSELRHVTLIIDQIDNRAVRASEDIVKAQEEVREHEAQLGERLKDRRVLDRLRDRQQAAWQVVDGQMDRELMDTLARARFQGNPKSRNSRNR
jgi:flagellar export protein FliJ